MAKKRQFSEAMSHARHYTDTIAEIVERTSKGGAALNNGDVDMRRFAALSCFLVAAMAFTETSVSAQERDAIPRPALLEGLLACRSITVADERLACFDRASEAFDVAERQGEVTVVDQAQAQETRTRLFGLNLNGTNLWGRLRQDTPVESIETTLVRASTDARGRAVLVLADGSTWRQVDSERINGRLREGVPVRIRQAAIGSFLLSVDGARSVRARRDQ